jgi:hypothetical protein
MRWFSSPKRRKKDFFQMLADQAAKTEEGLAALRAFLREPTEANAKVVKQFEEEADEFRRIVMDELNRTFVTVIDREDIYILSKSIDDLIDYAATTADEMVLFGIESDEYIERMVDLLNEAARETRLAVESLQKHPRVCTEHIIRARKAENAIEKTYRRALAALFTSNDFIRIFKTREVYRHLSNAADRVVEAMNVMGSILVKLN